jgi:hypothetical protein
MPSVWDRGGNWFSRQRQEYAIQRALGQRDAVAREIMQTQTQQEAAVDQSPDIEPRDREEQKLVVRKGLYDTPAAPERFRDYATARQPSRRGIRRRRRLNLEGKGIGGFFCRLFTTIPKDRARRASPIINDNTIRAFTTDETAFRAENAA